MIGDSVERTYRKRVRAWSLCDLAPVRAVWPDCLARTNRLVVSGETGGRGKAPAYAHNALTPTVLAD